jgi:hypothetical protein
MIKVECIPINLRIPSDEMRFVAMQPFMELDFTNDVPFRWCDEAIDDQITAITRTLDLAKDGFNGYCANFILFPEFAIPGLKGVNAIESAISSVTWPSGNVVIAGIHGISKMEYSEIWELIDAEKTPGQSPQDIPKDQWVNCCAIWVKDEKGNVSKWLQPKLQPSWPERCFSYKDMFQGSTVYLFQCEYEPEGHPCRFFSLICYDWIATKASSSVCDEVLQKLNEEWKPESKHLHLVFVIQHNNNPNHDNFLIKTNNFLLDRKTYEFVERSDAIVLHANTAVSRNPSGNGAGGFTSCIFSPKAQFVTNECRSTVCMQPERIRGSTILSRCHDVVFREMGECIHAFKVTVPRYIRSDASGKAFPLSLAQVHPFTISDDPRLCGGSVPAETKWLGDTLDIVESLSNTSLCGFPLETKARTIEPELIKKIRHLNGRSTNTLVNWAACSLSQENEIRNKDRYMNVDIWNQLEKDALEHIVHSLTSLRLAHTLILDPSELHASIKEIKPIVQIVAIRGNTFQDCLKHYNKHIRHSVSNVVLVILRDRDNLKMIPGELRNILDPNNLRGDKFIDYQTIISCCREAESSEDLKGKFDEFFPKHDRSII